MEILTKNLITLREAKGLTQGEVANALGVSLQTYRKWESGLFPKRINYLEHLIRISSFYNVTLNYLLLGDKSF